MAKDRQQVEAHRHSRETMPISLVVFDLDHTLVVSDHLPRVWLEMLRPHGVSDELILAQYRRTLGYNSETMIRACLPEADDALVEEIIVEASAWSDLHGNYEPRPGAGELLSEMRARGLSLALSTGAPQHRADGVLEAHGWTPFFDVVLGSEPEHPKSALHLELIAARLGKGDEEMRATTLTVGDGPNEMSSGREYGLDYRIGLVTDRPDCRADLLEAGATKLIDDLSEIVSLIDAID